MKKRTPRAIFSVLMAMLLLGATLMADAANSNNKLVELTIGKADTVNLGKNVADVLVANPAIADVGTLRSNRLYVVGKAIGDTNVLAFDDQGNQLANIAVRVRADETGIRDGLKNFFPHENIEISSIGDEVVLRGKVSTPAVANQVRDLAGRFVSTSGKTIVDLMTVGGEQQVMLKVKIIEAKRSVLREYGIDTSIASGLGGSATTTAGIATTPGIGLSGLAEFGTGTLAIAKRGNFGPVNVALQGLEQDGLVNTLAEPTLTAISGETAGFLAGGEFPVPTGRDTQGNISLEFKQFGVSLNFIPTVLSGDNMSLQLTTEVSDKSDEDSVTLVGTKIPGLTVRRAETTVQIGSGSTIMIAGLLKSESAHTLSGLPGIQDLPILGDLFKSKSFSRGESELVILVTPYIVKPYASPDAVDASNDINDKAPAMMMRDGDSTIKADPNLPQNKSASLIPPPPLPPAAAPSLPDVLPAERPVKAEAAPVIPVEKTALVQDAVKDNKAPATLTPDVSLSQTFNNTLKTVYGTKAPARAAAGTGYIVD